jgi:hypothetical protein
VARSSFAERTAKRAHVEPARGPTGHRPAGPPAQRPSAGPAGGPTLRGPGGFALSAKNRLDDSPGCSPVFHALDFMRLLVAERRRKRNGVVPRFCQAQKPEGRRAKEIRRAKAERRPKSELPKRASTPPEGQSRRDGMFGASSISGDLSLVRAARPFRCRASVVACGSALPLWIGPIGGERARALAHSTTLPRPPQSVKWPRRSAPGRKCKTNDTPALCPADRISGFGLGRVLPGFPADFGATLDTHIALGVKVSILTPPPAQAVSQSSSQCLFRRA